MFSRKGAFDRLREKMECGRTNGGVFLGLNGIVIKSHGGTDSKGSPQQSNLATTWCATICLTGSRPTSTVPCAPPDCPG